MQAPKQAEKFGAELAHGIFFAILIGRITFFNCKKHITAAFWWIYLSM